MRAYAQSWYIILLWRSKLIYHTILESKDMRDMRAYVQSGESRLTKAKSFQQIVYCLIMYKQKKKKHLFGFQVFWFIFWS